MCKTLRCAMTYGEVGQHFKRVVETLGFRWRFLVLECQYIVNCLHASVPTTPWQFNSVVITLKSSPLLEAKTSSLYQPMWTIGLNEAVRPQNEIREGPTCRKSMYLTTLAGQRALTLSGNLTKPIYS